MNKRRYADKLALAAGQKKREQDYWLTKLSGEPVKTGFPYDTRIEGGERDTIETRFPAAVSRRLIDVGGESDYTLHVILAAGLVGLLYKYTGCPDIIIGTPIYKQTRQGQFINTILPLRMQLTGDRIFREMLLQAKQVILEAIDHQSYPMEVLVERLNIPGQDSGFGLFDAALVLENIQDKKDIADSNPAMLFSFLRADHDLRLAITYQASLYRQAAVLRIARHLERLLTVVLRASTLPLSQVDLFSHQEKQQLLAIFNRTDTGYPRDKTIHCLFVEQAERTPDHIAVCGWREGQPDQVAKFPAPIALTFRELDERSGRLARRLFVKGVPPNSVVAIMPERTLALLTGILAILKTGSAYLPIDSEYPQERIQYMLADSSTPFLLTSRGSAGKIVNNDGLCFEILPIEEPPTKDETHIPPCPCPSVSVQVCTPGSIAYIIYTSGTTGRPKGALIEHRSVVRLFFNDAPLFDFNAADTWTLFHSHCFDFSVWEMYGALLFGGRLVIIDRRTARDPAGFRDILIEERATILNQTPSAFYSLLDEEVKHSRRQLAVRCVIFGGEALKPARIKNWPLLYPQTKLVNMFGITETTVHVTYKEITRQEIDFNINSIGRPIPGLSTYVMDSDLRLLPVGAFGELFVGGQGVSRGYLNQPELTAGKFLPDYNRSYKSNESYKSCFLEKIYRSGDLVRVTDDLELEYAGRIDHQVQVRGFRVELGEIETHLLRYPGIKEALALAFGQGEEQFICAYLVMADRSRPGEEIGPIKIPEVKELRSYLAERLPAYMIPNYFVGLEKIPLTANGKIDRRALPEPTAAAAVGCIAPRSEVEKKLVQVWSEVLGIAPDKIGIDADFFEIGGHSLNAAVLISRVHQECGVKVPLEEMFRNPTIRSLAEYIAAARREKFISIEPVEEKEYYDVSPAQRRLYLFQQVNPDSIVYNESSSSELNIDIRPERLRSAVDVLILRHESLRTSFALLDGQPVQRIHPAQGIPGAVEYDDLTPLPQEQRQPRLQEITRRFIRPFDLSRPPLFRVGLIKSAETQSVLLLDMHHIMVDGSSGRILAREFAQVYTGQPLPPLRFRYKDYSEWQNRSRLKENSPLQKQRRFWLEQFSGKIPQFDLPTDFPRPEIQGFAGDSESFSLSLEQTHALKKLAASRDATPYMVLLALFNVLFARLCSQEDIVIGVGTAGRSHPASQQIIGMFVNTLALRNFPQGHKTFSQFLDEVKKRTLAAFENQDYPFEDLVTELLPARDRSRSPLFDAAFVLDNIDASTVGIAPTGEPGPQGRQRFVINTGATKFDISIFAEDAGAEISFIFQYSTTLFKRETIRRYIQYFSEIVTAALADPDKKLQNFVVSHDLLTAKLSADSAQFEDFGF